VAETLKTQVILNPTAGNYKCKRAFPALKSKLLERGIAHHFCFSRYRGHITELALKAKNQGYEKIIVGGGDGTINEAINALVGSDVKLGVLPLGRGNDFARNLGIKEDLDFACSVLDQGKVRTVDVVKVNGSRYYGSVGGIGFDSEVASWANRYKKFAPGINTYLLGILAKIFTFKFKKVEITYDTKHYKGEILLAAFGNTKWYGGGINITPTALMDDGWLDICIVEKINKIKLLFLFPSTFKGNHTKFQEVKLHRAKNISINSETPLQLLGDGEIICQTPVYLRVVPQALRVIAPCEG
jgi:YegS/Rv2252/BmrU family lipid kinase